MAHDMIEKKVKQFYHNLLTEIAFFVLDKTGGKNLFFIVKISVLLC